MCSFVSKGGGVPLGALPPFCYQVVLWPQCKAEQQVSLFGAWVGR